MKYSNTPILYSLLIMSTLMVINANSWLNMWLGLELNLLMFLPLISIKKNPLTTTAMMTYFLIQSLGSIMFLMMILLTNSTLMNNNLMNMMTETIMINSMMIKLGVPPFHFWFPEMMNNLDWNSALILMTWQKIAPLIILTYMYKYLTPYILMAISIGSIGGLNQTSTRKIMAYSSINHLGWILAAIKMNSNSWITYMMFYSLMITMTLMVFKVNSINMINQIPMNSSYHEKTLMSITLMSLGGLPPFIGFIPSWIIIQNMLYSNLNSILIMMVLFTLITLFYYLRMISASLMIKHNLTKWNTYNKKKLNSALLMMNMLLPLITIMNMTY